MNLSKISLKNRFMFLACDQGLEHGPRDFNEKNINPEYVLNIALEGGFTGVILGHGIAEKYWTGEYRKIPLIVKLNGKTSIGQREPVSRQLCSVERAVRIGASAVGYTIYPGSEYEEEMLQEFGKIVEEAHEYGIPAIAWIYPRGKYVQDDLDNNILAYGARIGLEVGADILKMKYNGDNKNFHWMTRCAGKAKIIISGGRKIDELGFLKNVKTSIEYGGAGVAVGRNIWQSERPFSLAKALRAVVFDNLSAEEAYNRFFNSRLVHDK